MSPAKEELSLKIPPLDLEMPKPLEISRQGTTLFAFTIEGYGTLLKIFTGYTLWADNYIAESELEAAFEVRLEGCQLRLNLKDDNIADLKEDRDHAYDLFNQERKEIPKLKRKNTLKIIFVSGSVGIVALAGGVLIGFFAGR
jgi:hypothetical protein